jgi:hypothetical protein
VFSYFYNKENKQYSQLFLPVYNYAKYKTERLTDRFNFQVNR